jgi:hypothetical protein
VLRKFCGDCLNKIERLSKRIECAVGKARTDPDLR